MNPQTQRTESASGCRLERLVRQFSTSFICNERWMSIRANQHVRAFRFSLQDGFLSLLVAGGTKPVQWLTKRFGCLEAICKNSRSKHAKRIARAFLLPLFIGYEFLFRIFFGLQRLLILRLNCRHLGLQFKDCSLKFNGDIVNLNLNMCVKKALGYAGYLGQCAINGGETNHIEIVVLPNEKAEARLPDSAASATKKGIE